jgi:hypothetical protein
MTGAKPFELLTLTIALSVYVATVRLFVLGKLTATTAPPEKKKKHYKLFLILLLPADICLVIAGSLLFCDIFWMDLVGLPPWAWLKSRALQFLLIGLMVLIAHHIAAWVMTVRNAWDLLNRSS